MPEILRLYVSTTLDLDAERAVIGRTVAELPVKLGIEIRRAPQLTPVYDEIYERLANVDRVYFLLGNDITAPAGLEWHLAWRIDRSILPLRRSPKPTPAAQEFVRLSPAPWLDFRTSTDLARIITLDLAMLLRQPENRYGVNVQEIEQLERVVRQLEKKHAAPVQDPGGAEGGGVLLDDGRREPLAGVLLRKR
jgi:hypothetical protein